MSAFPAMLRKAALTLALRASRGGRYFLRPNANPDDRVRRSLMRLVQSGLLTQREIATRADTLFAAGEGESGWFLLDTALAATPDAHALVGRRLRRLAFERRHDELASYATDLLEARDRSPGLLRQIVIGLNSAALPHDDPLVIQAARRFEQSLEGRADAAHRRLSLYDDLGFAALADWSASAESPERSIKDSVASAIWQGPFDRALALLGELHAKPSDAYTPENRLLLVGNTLAAGGMERVFAQTYRHYADDEGFDQVDMALLRFDPDHSTGFFADLAGISAETPIVLERYRTPGAEMARLPPNLAGRAQHLYDHVRETRPRVIHAWNDQIGILAAYAGLLAGCPRIIVHFHHNPAVPLASRTGYVDGFPHAYRALLDHHAVRPIFCAEAAASAYADWWGLHRDPRFHVLYNGFDWPAPRDPVAAKAALGLAPETPLIGTVMRFHDVKQPRIWADAAIRLAEGRTDVHFLMVGDGPLRQDVADHFADAGIGDRLIMPGQVSDVAELYAAMDIFWLTSKSEGLPNVCVEAQFFGVPVIAFDVGGMGETFVDGETGRLVAPDDIAALTEATDALLADAVRRGQMGAAARIFAEKTFSAEIYFGYLNEIYDQQ